MKSPSKRSATQGFLTTESSGIRRAVGYIRVSTDMQAADGLSLEAQQAAIEQYCNLHGYRLSKICRDVLSGAKEQRRGLQDALDSLERGADVLIVLKFDRLSRSIRHFCELYERYTYLQIASILNTQGWLPRKGPRFTPRSVRQLLGKTKGIQLLSPRKYLANLLERMEHAHQKENPGEPFQRPGYARLATLLTEAGYVTPRGYARWWPAQVQQLLGGRFERYYAARAERAGQASPERLG